ncbi:protein-ER retention protein, partial [Ascosphaera pollenicola]
TRLLEDDSLWHEWAKLPITVEEYSKKVAELQLQLFPTCAPLPGAVKLISDLSSTAPTANPVHIALATSSTNRNYHLKADNLQDLFSLFPVSRRVVGDDPRIGAGRGKPLPDIYLLALETINSELRAEGKPEIKPEECLVFEDSVSGVEAGRRAGMQVAWVPMAGLLNEYRGREEEVLAGRTGEHKDEELPPMEKPEEWRKLSPGKAGEIGDGFGRMFSSLEGFPYESYGMHIPSMN